MKSFKNEKDLKEAKSSYEELFSLIDLMRKCEELERELDLEKSKGVRSEQE